MQRNQAEQQRAGAAVRVDSRTGIHERAEFFGPEETPLFGYLHKPAVRPAGGVVICPSIWADLVANYRREVVTARALAENGVAVQRFHYRGTGSSGGDPAAVSFDGLREDALLATTQLLREEDVSQLAFLGTRWGGLVAAAAASNYPDAPLVLWEPTLQADQYFREGFRAKMMHAVKGRERATSKQQLIAELAAKGCIDLLGYEVFAQFYDGAQSLTLPALLGTEPRPVLLVQFSQLSQETGLRHEYREFVSALEAQGFDVETTTFSTSGSWWFPGDNFKKPESLSRCTVEWLSRHLGKPSSTRGGR